MKKKNVTKGALLASILAMVLCLTMLVGTTFAWFTDTASAKVNKIQSGNLDVALEYATAWDGEGNPTAWADATTLERGLSFLRMKEDGTREQASDILWEPGCTYTLPELRISNQGSLSLKYKVVITGIDGNAELNNVIDWTAKVGDTTYNLTDEHQLAAKNGDTVDADILTISGHMQETAGNDYMNKELDGISITVYATQDTAEFDSISNEYDKNADGTPDNPKWSENSKTEATVETEGETVVKDNENNPTITVTVPQGSTTATTLTLEKVQTSTPSTVEVVTGTQAFSYDVSLKDQAGNKVTAVSGKSFKVELQLASNLNVIDFLHNGVSMTKAAGADAVALDQYYYDAATGVVTFVTDDFSPFTAVYSDSAFNGGKGTKAAPYLIATGEQARAMENAKGYFKLVGDIVVTDEVYLSGKKVVVDLNGHSIKLDYAEGVKPNNGSVLYIGGKRGNLTINDSSAAQTGAVIGSDKTYTNKVTSAVRAGNNGKLTINGGHFYGMSEGTSCIFVLTNMSSNSKATVVINGGKFETATPSNNIYYVLNHQDGATGGCTITVNGGSFKNYNPGVTAVDPVNAKTGKIVLGTGCTTTERKDGSDIWYTVSK